MLCHSTGLGADINSLCKDKLFPKNSCLSLTKVPSQITPTEPDIFNRTKWPIEYFHLSLIHGIIEAENDCWPISIKNNRKKLKNLRVRLYFFF